MKIDHSAESCTADVLILGGGLAGMIAADEIVRSGAEVLLLRPGGGASPFVHGFSLPVLPVCTAR